MTKFEPKNLDGLAAASRLRNAGKVTPGWCLQVTWQAFGSPKSDGEQGGYQWATDARKGAQAKGALVPGRLEDAPAGAVLYWSGVMGTWLRDGKRIWGDAGHVAIMTADRRIATIDLPVRGFTGAVTPAEFRRAWGHLKFEGWAIGPGAFLGHTVLGVQEAAKPGLAAPGSPAPILEVEDMPKIVQVTVPAPGTVALITEHSARIYTSPSGEQGDSIAANRQAFGAVLGFTEGQVALLAREAEARGEALVKKIAQASRS
ncbi:hypothetical protein M2390_000505 [Mycetocola sp. BIGb0189]|uniref:hypothetical protein n=1 Tax=Mycetocola sp. BIGb0189 TaxID=2940604 RepID=UPI002167F41C|nr:hypothetical protein [Mycetocola sp. BIGb0189]MCS4275344.1 hypothetical protein [Mycetocola sp. BIGb0189]